jgi:hypothetical protein
MPGARGGQEEEIEEVDTAWYRTEPDFNEYPVYGVPYAADGLHAPELHEQQAELVEMEVTQRPQEAYQPTYTDVVEYARFLGIQVHVPNPQQRCAPHLVQPVVRHTGYAARGSGAPVAISLHTHDGWWSTRTAEWRARETGWGGGD